VEAVILFPAVDLKNGQCVRLEQGDMARATVFNLDPAAQARAFAGQGFEYLHVVDLDGAFAGKPMNALAVESMLKAVTMPVQLGGGIRDLKTVEAWLDKGIARVIIGTAAVRDPELVKSAAKKFPGRVAVGLDARDGMLKGLDFDGTRALGQALSIPVIASGGLAALADIETLLLPENHAIAGAITGRALYDGRLDAAAALSLLRKAA
jgi:phosphoribosylformimino-5-aminoimidazole carboxamide ribotide isomerase